MKSIVYVLAVAAAGFLPSAAVGFAKAQAVTQPFSVTVTVVPVVSGIGLSGSTVSTTGPNNAGTVVGAVSVITNPPGGTYTGTLTLSGTNASSFALTNGGKLPCNLVVGSSNLAAGTYSVSITAN